MRRRKTWREKLETVSEARIIPIPPRMQARYGQGTLLIPRALDVDAVIRSVPEARVITISEIRSVLAFQAGADIAHPVVTGLFVWLSAEASVEAENAGSESITPWWRVIRDNGQLMENLPGGAVAQARRLKLEGHWIVAKGRHLKVVLGDSPQAPVLCR